MENTEILKAEIKSILAVKARKGAKFQDVRDEYAYLMGKEICFDSAKQFNNFMRAVPDVYSDKGHDGHLIWYTKSKNSEHIATMVQKQRPPRGQKIPLKRKVFYNSTSRCYYNDNYFYKSQRKSNTDSRSNEFKRDRKLALFYNYELIGDDFFLNVANLDCKCEIECLQSAVGYKGRPIKKCGLCISGQYISDVTTFVKSTAKLSEDVILNIGSVDLLHGRDLVDMKHDFLVLYSQFYNRGIEPIITTLAPLGNMCHLNEYQIKWEAFNSFLKNNFPVVLDIASCFLTNNQRVLFDCYQPLPKYVSGSNHAHLLWNFVGRQRVLKYLKDGIAEITYRSSF